ncbi:methylmalonyl-CoA mutase family protein [Candidatus Villigracilis saccharophilus]|uniref:methylmalonyl-CoA mutase family protein n=1 Tax=Candidatus Villigracilis saccharophilus TaxID=3140684 RepID=UPI003134775F|nr:hypothetical protein [Anaerolineales bacterium]
MSSELHSRRSAAVLGGTQSLHTNSMDEALAHSPSEHSVTIALRINSRSSRKNPA